MDNQVDLLNWLQENTEILNSWYNNKLSSDDVVKQFRKETPEPKLFKISGYWKDDGKEFSDYIVSAYDGFSDDENIEIDDEIFFYGMSEEEIKEAIVHGQETGEDFVITSYKIYR